KCHRVARLLHITGVNQFQVKRFACTTRVRVSHRQSQDSRVMNRSTIRCGWVQRHWMVAAVLVTLWLIPMPALAQSDTSAAPSSAQSAAPKPVTGVAFDSPFALEEVGHVLIRGSVRAGETFDDNIAGGGVSDWYTSIVPAVSLQLTRRHSVVHANYAPSFLIYSRFDQFN